MEENRKIKIPGMLYILISFIPWIIYWILCSMGNTLRSAYPLNNLFNSHKSSSPETRLQFDGYYFSSLF